MIFEIVKFGKFLGIFRIESFWKLQNLKFLEFFKLKFFGIFQIDNVWNFPNCDFLDFIV